MLLEDIYRSVPKHWSPMDYCQERYKLVRLPSLTDEYRDVRSRIMGSYFSYISGIYRVQNPYLYSKYVLKTFEYERNGLYKTLQLYHDTPRENTLSIVEYNFDWRYGDRCKYGPGVYFSISPTLANKHSHRTGSLCRSMFIADVLVQNVQEVQGDIFLPDFGFDTVLAHNNETYVKYFDCEFYPRYFVDYISLW